MFQQVNPLVNFYSPLVVNPLVGTKYISSSSPPPTDSFLLLSDGGFFLLSDGGLLELVL